ncbi:unnamed protein product [Taenia asiatica]|uniref:Protein kinase domain-containing protein n=1 Tax=Taenia asiatica TaxID=60517 RepID=A0A0R3VWK4_TAEAS|nr:unnamed protein product [Taenia asiatica]
MKSVHHPALLAIKFVGPAIARPTRHCKEANDSPRIVDTIDFVVEHDADISNNSVNSVDESYTEFGMA